MKRLFALILLVAGVGYVVVKEFPKDIDPHVTETKIDRMMDTMATSETTWEPAPSF
jgi:hypothetical protein